MCCVCVYTRVDGLLQLSEILFYIKNVGFFFCCPQDNNNNNIFIQNATYTYIYIWRWGTKFSILYISICFYFKIVFFEVIFFSQSHFLYAQYFLFCFTDIYQNEPFLMFIYYIRINSNLKKKINYHSISSVCKYVLLKINHVPFWL